MLTLQDCGAPYQVLLEERGWALLAEQLKTHFTAGSVVIISQAEIWKRFGTDLSKELLQQNFEPLLFLLPEGEGAKSWDSVQRALDFLLEQEVDRTRPVLAVGGGSVGDAAGFVAATFKRGLPLVHVPTTLLAQVDSSIGGKVGINFGGVKNSVGTFYSPAFVYVNLEVLESLDPRSWRSGWAEVIKVAAIGDSELFFQLEEEHFSQKTTSALVSAIARAIKIKGRITAVDPFDRKGIRTKLNFGHTIGHAVESAAGLQSVTHGEAVAIGMSVEAMCAAQLAFCSQQTVERLQSLLTFYGLPINGEGSAGWNEWAKQDKKRNKNTLDMVMLKEIGKVEVHNVSWEGFLECIQRF